MAGQAAMGLVMLLTITSSGIWFAWATYLGTRQTETRHPELPHLNLVETQLRGPEGTFVIESNSLPRSFSGPSSRDGGLNTRFPVA